MLVSLFSVKSEELFANNLNSGFAEALCLSSSLSVQLLYSCADLGGEVGSSDQLSSSSSSLQSNFK